MKIKISIYIIFFLIVLYILDMLNYYLIVYISVLMHELVHVIVGKMYGLKVKRINIEIFGCNVFFEKFNLCNIKKIIILVSGPLFNIIVGIIMVTIFKDFNNYIAFSNIFLGIFNLIPIYPLDGGKIISILIKDKYICKNIKYIFCILILILCSLVLINYNNFILFFMGLYILFNCAINKVDKQM